MHNSQTRINNHRLNIVFSADTSATFCINYRSKIRIMKIISKVKDYYDYLTSKYGLDETVVFDRREFYLPSKHVSSLFFSTERFPTDKPRKKSWLNPDGRGDLYSAVLEVGNMFYSFEIERYIIDTKSQQAVMNWTLKYQRRGEKHHHFGRTPLTFYAHTKLTERDSLDKFPKQFGYTYYLNKPEIYSNLILKETPISSIISPDEIYQELYAYISGLKDIEFADTRTDVQKLLSAGFDKKTSFRNM